LPELRRSTVALNSRSRTEAVSVETLLGRPVVDVGTLGHVILRAATLDDALLLLDWRNDPVTRTYSRRSELVSTSTETRPRSR
jgi:hypothetical protein